MTNSIPYFCPQIDAVPFRQWYLQHYGAEIGSGKKKPKAAAAKKEVFSFSNPLPFLPFYYYLLLKQKSKLNLLNCKPQMFLNFCMCFS